MTGLTFSSPAVLVVKLDAVYAPPPGDSFKLRDVTVGETAQPGTATVIEPRYIGVVPGSFFTWNAGDVMQIDAPGWGLIPAGSILAIEMNQIISVIEINATTVRVRFQGPVDATFAPDALLSDDTAVALTSGPKTNFAPRFLDYTKAPGTFVPGNSWSINAGIWGGNPAQTGLVA